MRPVLLDEHSVVLAGAQAHIKGKVFRIGHMGHCSFTDLLATFGAIEARFKKLGYTNFDTGASVKEIIERM